MDTNGNIAAEKLSEYHDKNKNIVYDPTMPIDSVFSAIQ
jgi:hypothetical protein